MKTGIVDTLAAAAAALVLSVSALPAHAVEVPVGAATSPAPLEEMNVTGVVSDVHGLTEKAAAFARNIMPNITGAQIRAMLGNFVGDPSLEGMKPGAGAALLLPPRGGMVLFLEVSPDKIESYEKVFKGPAMNVERTEGMLMISERTVKLADAKALASTVKKSLLDTAGQPDLNLDIRLARLLTEYEGRITSGIETMDEAMSKSTELTAKGQDPKAIARLIRAEMQMGLKLGKRIDHLRVNIAPSAEALDVTYNFTGPNVKPAGASASTTATAVAAARMLPMMGAVRMGADWDMKAMYTDFANIGSEFIVALGGTPAQAKAAHDLSLSWSKIAGRLIAADYLTPDTSPTASSFVIEVTDEDAALAFFEKLPEQMKATGWMELTMPGITVEEFTFEKNVRTVADTPIHKMVMKYGGMNEDQLKVIQAMYGANGLEIEVAIVNKMVIYGMGAAKIENLIAAVKAGKAENSKPLAAEKLGPGAMAMMDINLADMMKVVFQMVSPTLDEKDRGAVESIFKGVKEAPPISGAAYREANGYRIQWHIPGKLVSALAESARNAMMQQPGMSPTRQAPATPDADKN